MRITNIQVGKKSVPANFTMAPGETITLRFEGDAFVVMREMRFPMTPHERVARVPRVGHGRRRGRRAKVKEIAT